MANLEDLVDASLGASDKPGVISINVNSLRTLLFELIRFLKTAQEDGSGAFRPSDTGTSMSKVCQSGLIYLKFELKENFWFGFVWLFFKTI